MPVTSCSPDVWPMIWLNMADGNDRCMILAKSRLSTAAGWTSSIFTPSAWATRGLSENSGVTTFEAAAFQNAQRLVSATIRSGESLPECAYETENARICVRTVLAAVVIASELKSGNLRSQGLELRSVKLIYQLLAAECRSDQSTISRPIWRAVPAMMRKAASSLRAFKSFAFVFTMSITCFRVTLPTLVLLGSLEPAAMLAAFFNNTAAGGLLVMKVNDLSLKTVITTGRMSPACFWVAALNSLQNAMMLIPRGPSAVPTGGAGFACPAGICNLM